MDMKKRIGKSRYQFKTPLLWTKVNCQIFKAVLDFYLASTKCWCQERVIKIADVAAEIHSVCALNAETVRFLPPNSSPQQKAHLLFPGRSRFSASRYFNKDITCHDTPSLYVRVGSSASVGLHGAALEHVLINCTFGLRFSPVTTVFKHQAVEEGL